MFLKLEKNQLRNLFITLLSSALFLKLHAFFSNIKMKECKDTVERGKADQVRNTSVEMALRMFRYSKNHHTKMLCVLFCH
jgi:hypothetical protein